MQAKKPLTILIIALVVALVLLLGSSGEAWALSAYHAEKYNWSSNIYNGVKADIYTPNHSISIPGQTIKSVVRGPELLISDPSDPDWGVNAVAEVGWYWCYPHATPWAFFTTMNYWDEIVIADYTDIGINQHLVYELILRNSYEPYDVYIGGGRVGSFDIPWGYEVRGLNGESPDWISSNFKWHAGSRMSTSSLQMESWVYNFSLRAAYDGHYVPNAVNNTWVSSPFTISGGSSNFETKANWPY